MQYTVSELAKMAGISPRTLRYYDKIKLLSPKREITSRYRKYDEEDVNMLQQILFYKRMGFSLSKIEEMIHHPEFNYLAALNQHLAYLLEEAEQIQCFIEMVKQSILKEKGEIKMRNEEKFKAFKEEMIRKNEQKFGNEIRKKYGSETIDQSNQKIMELSKADYDSMKDLEKRIKTDLEAAVLAKESPMGESGKNIADMHKKWLSYTLPSYSAKMHHEIAKMYVADERFQKYYDKNVAGCAEFLKDAVCMHIK